MNGARRDLNGEESERSAPLPDKGRNVLSEFSVVKILASRSMCTVMCVYFLSSSMNKILVGKGSSAGEYKVMLGLIGAAVGVVTCILYYSSYKEFDELKK